MKQSSSFFDTFYFLYLFEGDSRVVMPPRVPVRFMFPKIPFRVILEQKSAKHFSDTQSVVGRERAKDLEKFF